MELVCACAGLELVWLGGLRGRSGFGVCLCRFGARVVRRGWKELRGRSGVGVCLCRFGALQRGRLRSQSAFERWSKASVAFERALCGGSFGQFLGCFFVFLGWLLGVVWVFFGGCLGVVASVVCFWQGITSLDPLITTRNGPM